MARWGLWALPLALVMGCASASSYDDYTRGLSALTAQRYDLAIQSLSAALNAGDLAPPYIPVAHTRRATAYMAVGDCKNAVSDLNAAETAQKANTEFFLIRLRANLCVGDKAAAERDFSALLALRPETLHAMFYSNYAVGLWTVGDFSAASAKFAGAIQRANPKDAHSSYLGLFYTMSAIRAGQFDPAVLDNFAAKISTDWPMPVLNFYRGKITSEQLYLAAADHDAVLAGQQKCEVDFYLGEWQLAHGDKTAGAPLIHLAAEECPHTFSEYYLALTEEKRLKK